MLSKSSGHRVLTARFVHPLSLPTPPPLTTISLLTPPHPIAHPYLVDVVDVESKSWSLVVVSLFQYARSLSTSFWLYAFGLLPIHIGVGYGASTGVGPVDKACSRKGGRGVGRPRPSWRRPFRGPRDKYQPAPCILLGGVQGEGWETNLRLTGWWVHMFV